MENSNSSRFCTKYVKFVGMVETLHTKSPGFGNLIVNGVKFEFSRYSMLEYNVGDVVYIAVMQPTSKYAEHTKWSIHQVKLAELYCMYKWYEERSPKQQSMCPYKPMANTAFKRNTFIINKIK